MQRVYVMNNKKGFTLTEILLAVMIVGIIGVALAALTTAASRESGVGRSKVLLRNNLSIALRELRRDVQQSTRVLYVRGGLGYSLGTDAVPLLMLGKNVDQDDNPIEGLTASYVTYCFARGGKGTTSSNAPVLPSGAYDGGVIYRTESGSASWSGNVPSCSTSNKWLNNVKYIPGSNPNSSSATEYPSPYFHVKGFSGTYNVKSATSSVDKEKLRLNLGSVLEVNLVTELPSNPVVNDVTEEIFLLPNGFQFLK